MDVNFETAYRFPELYKTLLLSRDLNVLSLTTWVWKSVYQGSVIFMFSIYFFKDAFIEIVTITYSALIFCELLMTYFEVLFLPFLSINGFRSTISTKK